MTLPAEVDQVVALARGAGLRAAAAWIERARWERWPIRDWELGACLWCEVDYGKRRKAVELEHGGIAVCGMHAWLLPSPDPVEVGVLLDVRAQRVVVDERAAEILDVLRDCDLVDSRFALKPAGALALRTIEAEHREAEQMWEAA